MNAEERLREARCLLLTHEPWYGHAAVRMHWLPSSHLGTMGVCVRGAEVHCYYNPSFANELTVPELCAVVQHEVEHVVRCHCLRDGGKHARVWNIAADMAVNGPKHKARIGLKDRCGARIVPHRDSLVWVPPAWPSEETAEYYYRRLVCRAKLSGFGITLDDHSVWSQSDVSAAEQREVARCLAEQAARSGVPAPGHLTRVLSQLTRSQIPWSVLLQRYLGACLVERRPSYSRRNRRRRFFGVPGYVGRRQPHVSVVVDVSGSISAQELSLFFTELERICDSARLTVLLWDAALQGFIANYRRGDWKSISMTGGGGTNMAAPVDWLERHRAVGDCVVLFTDGLCNWPPRRPFPLIVVLSKPGVPDPPWGKVVRLDRTGRTARYGPV